MSDGIHTCSYYCQRPGCVLAQRNELRARGFDRLPSDKVVMEQALDALTTFRKWEMGQDYHSDRSTVLRLAFRAEEALTAALEAKK